MKEAIIAPSILTADFANLEAEISRVSRADWLHLDVMDGRFVPNLTFGPMVVGAVRRVWGRFLDAHLMIEDPERYVGDFAAAGANLITVHAEATPHLHRCLQMIRDCGCKAGVAINPGTPAVAVNEVLSVVDVVLVMSVNPGFGGQEFIPASVDKIRRVREAIDRAGRPVRIQIDGGIGPANIREACRAGASIFVAGSAVFGAEDPAQAVEELKNKALF